MVEINSGNETQHLVAMVNVEHSATEAHDGSRWHLFNDFLVRQIPEEKALWFTSWKLPTVLAYQGKSKSHAVDNS